jgi:hypothetical protein
MLPTSDYQLVSKAEVQALITLYINVDEFCANEDEDVVDANTDEDTVVTAVQWVVIAVVNLQVSAFVYLRRSKQSRTYVECYDRAD